MGLILASGSPRRRTLLTQAGIRFKVRVPFDVDESPRPREKPEAMAIRLSTLKSLSVSRRCKGGLVLGCDTLVVVGNRVLGKPADKKVAHAMIRELSNRSHRVLTSLAWARGGRLLATEWVETAVTFGPVPAVDLESYLESREPYDKAGAYGIQGFAGRWVQKLEGDYYNVMGLPVARVLQQLWEYGRKTGF